MNVIHKCICYSFGIQEAAKVAVPPASNVAVHIGFLRKPESLFFQSVLSIDCDCCVFREIIMLAFSCHYNFYSFYMKYYQNARQKHLSFQPNLLEIITKFCPILFVNYDTKTLVNFWNNS